MPWQDFVHDKAVHLLAMTKDWLYFVPFLA
jgi:hypothetical protein